MSNMHSSDSRAQIEYKKQLKYYKDASLFNLNNGKSKNKRASYQHLAQSVTGIKDPNMKASKIEDEYPKLLNELNDSSSAIPAYARF